MKSLVFLGCLLAVAAVVRAEVSTEGRKLIEFCLKEAGMTEEMWEEARKKNPEEMDGETKRKWSCMNKCLLQNYRVIDEGKYNKEFVTAMSTRMEPNDQEKQNALKKLLGDCVDEANIRMGEDECEIAGSFVYCLNRPR